MFSATFNRECRSLARKYLGVEYIRIRIGRAGSSHLNVHHRASFYLGALDVYENNTNRALDGLCGAEQEERRPC